MATEITARLHLVQGNVSLTENGPFVLQNGRKLTEVSLRYACYGEPNADCSNVTLVCHAFSGTSRVDQWWPELLPALFDLDHECVLCFNVIGSCYGSTSASSLDPATGKPYGSTFPITTVRDWVRAQKLALEQLGITHLKAILGPSLGGMQALQWAVEYPEWAERVVAMGATRLNALGLGLNHLQREAIRLDPEFKGGDYYDGPGPRAGLAVARGIAMTTYKSSELFQARHGRKPDRKGKSPFEHEDGRFDIEGYLNYQGNIFWQRFDANTYFAMTKAMDLFDPQMDWKGEAWRRVQAKVLLLGISSDWLFPDSDVKAFADELLADGVACRYQSIESAHGHDAFLAEPDSLLGLLHEFLHEGDAQAGEDFRSAAAEKVAVGGKHGISVV
ncbi:MAG: homoserine O-acetyltransferase [Acidobacteriota bacterium]|nr:homoserine O-acetyltransferase [Acidobacteriota bacterium]